MSKKIFIETIEKLIASGELYLEDAAAAGFQSFKDSLKKGESTSEVSEAGARVLEWMQTSIDNYNNIASAKTISEQMGLPSSRSVSGTMRKLIELGYVTKSGTNPVHYSLTEKGREYTNLTI